MALHGPGVGFPERAGGEEENVPGGGRFASGFREGCCWLEMVRRGYAKRLKLKNTSVLEAECRAGAGAGT